MVIPKTHHFLMMWLHFCNLCFGAYLYLWYLCISDQLHVQHLCVVVCLQPSGLKKSPRKSASATKLTFLAELVVNIFQAS